MHKVTVTMTFEAEHFSRLTEIMGATDAESLSDIDGLYRELAGECGPDSGRRLAWQIDGPTEHYEGG